VENPKTHAAAITEIAKYTAEKPGPYGYNDYIIRHPNFTAEATNIMANAKDHFQRMFVASSPLLSSDSINKLANDDNYLIKEELLKNPKITSEVLTEMTKNEVSAYVSKINYTDETKYAHQLKLLFALAEHELITTEALEELSKVDWERLQLLVAQNPRTSGKVLTHLIKCTDLDSEIVKTALANPNCPMKTMLEHAEKMRRINS